MKQQIALPGLEDLSERQELALDYIRSHPGSTNEEIGEHVRVCRGARGEEFDTPNGKALAESLLAAGLVKRLRHQRWAEAEHEEREPDPEPVECCERWPYCECSLRGAA